MYCYNCGEFFHEDDRIVTKNCNGETVGCCPHCGSDDIGESDQCKMCGSEFVADDLAYGYCIECLWNEIDYDMTLEYLKSEHLVSEFVIEYILGGKLDHASDDLDRFCEEAFRRMIAEDKILRQHDFLDKCRYFCIPERDKGSFFKGGYNYAGWYDEYRTKIEKEVTQ